MTLLHLGTIPEDPEAKQEKLRAVAKEIMAQEKFEGTFYPIFRSFLCNKEGKFGDVILIWSK